MCWPTRATARGRTGGCCAGAESVTPSPNGPTRRPTDAAEVVEAAARPGSTRPATDAATSSSEASASSNTGAAWPAATTGSPATTSAVSPSPRYWLGFHDPSDTPSPRSAEIDGLQVPAHPAEPRRLPPAVLLEAQVGVDRDDEQRLGGRVVDKIPWQLPEPRRWNPLPAMDAPTAAGPAARRAHAARAASTARCGPRRGGDLDCRAGRAAALPGRPGVRAHRPRRRPRWSES